MVWLNKYYIKSAERRQKQRGGGAVTMPTHDEVQEKVTYTSKCHEDCSHCIQTKQETCLDTITGRTRNQRPTVTIPYSAPKPARHSIFFNSFLFLT